MCPLFPRCVYKRPRGGSRAQAGDGIRRRVFVLWAVRGLRRAPRGEAAAPGGDADEPERASAVPAVAVGRACAGRVRADAAVPGRAGRHGPAGVEPVLPPADVPRELHPGVRARVLQVRAAGRIRAGAPVDIGPKWVGQFIAGDPDIDAEEVSPAPASSPWRRRRRTPWRPCRPGPPGRR